MTRNVKRKSYDREYGRNTNNMSYVSGSAARKLQVVETVPEIERRRKKEYTEEDRQRREERQKKINRANHINFLYTAAVTGIAVVMFSICWQYLNLQASVKNNAVEISKMQAQLTKLTTENDETETDINAGIDYDSIYDTAVNELGMVHPKKSQVVTYDPGKAST